MSHDPALVVAALVAGWVDAVVGGGGLIQLPALLLFLPGALPAQILATNKVSSICGTSVSAVTYARRIRPQVRTVVPMAALALVGAVGGALVASHVPEGAFRPIVLVALVVVATFTWLRPALGAEAVPRFHGHRHVLTAGLVGLGIGVYDGALGPGRGPSWSSRSSGCSAWTSCRPAARPRSPTPRRTWARSSSSSRRVRRCGGWG